MTSTTINLRKITHNDHSFIKKLLTNPNLMMTGWGKIFTEDDVHLWINKILTGYQQDGFSYFLVSSAISEPIGIAGLISTTIQGQDYVEVAYIIDEPFQGKGIATIVVKQLITEAFTTYNLSELAIQCALHHTASQRVAQKCGARFAFNYERSQHDQLVPYHVYLIHPVKLKR
ncbi:GNAT family N-acetyltransferase [Vagococcus xieshaowenii]|uniref:N-acetyltransferase n=1 Tax=Vagococcus xieshaowenii TaxID=2562451 RepID=A0A4Z0DEI6_9ENTE|nr:GNAT family N-acetyltransferase [Vagococcus xieshaowenii]QCA29237.1 N-acetyltransferase [Vagococcus xieshaowenii]TFZ43250.1 N-acetyltransferase [Vagococcus xieshaowenii]